VSSVKYELDFISQKTAIFIVITVKPQILPDCQVPISALFLSFALLSHIQTHSSGLFFKQLTQI
jgi:xanthine/uracil/vitamin C permease (AzgA family)